MTSEQEKTAVEIAKGILASRELLRDLAGTIRAIQEPTTWASKEKNNLAGLVSIFTAALRSN